MNKRVHFVVHGMVQGVSYRYHAQKTAESLGLTGFARNLANGDIEITAEGEETMINELVEWCRRGPAFARVANLEFEWENPTNEFTEFGIRF